jgi:glucan phosphorylase
MDAESFSRVGLSRRVGVDAAIHPERRPHMGKLFSSDRTIRQYVDEVWRVAPIKME